MNLTIKRGLLSQIKKHYPDVVKLIFNGETNQVVWTDSSNKKSVSNSTVDLSMLMNLYKMNKLDFVEIDFKTEKIILTGDKEIEI